MKPYRSLYAYPWDVLDAGVSHFVDDVLAMGIHDVTLAMSYHAGKFLRPHARRGPKVIFPEDGVVYFEPALTRYGEIKPQPHSDPEIRGVLDDLLEDGRLRVHGWTVLLHNTRLGQLHPQFTAHNVFGDSYPYSLCPMHDEVFHYALTLSADLTRQYPLKSIVLETPGWLPYAHGYHHEFSQVRSNVWLDAMLGLCFCPACCAQAAQKGIAIESLQRRIAARIDACLTGPSDLSPDQAHVNLQKDMERDSDLAAFIAMRQTRVTQLVAAIRRALPQTCQLAVIPTVQRPSTLAWLEGSDLSALAANTDWLEMPFYEPTASRTIADASATLQQVKNASKLRAILRPGPPDLGDGAELNEAMDGLQKLGIRDFAFYNYGLLRRERLDALAGTLKTFDAEHP
jgi:hypothetical protein